MMPLSEKRFVPIPIPIPISGGALVVAAAFLPAVASAAPANFKDFAYTLVAIVQTATFFLGTVLLLVFFFGIARFVWNSSNSQKHSEDKAFLFWSVICLAVMFSVWGLVEILRITLVN